MSSFDQLEQASLTDVGVRRSHNQDNFAVQLATDAEQWAKCGHFFLVADGMGGHAVGEKASELAASIIPHTYSKHAAEGVPAALRKAFLEANASIHAYGEQNHEFRGTGTTSTALVLRPDGAWLGHVGDSRAYRIRAGLIEQLTYDHSYVWEYARLKHIDPSEVQDFPSNVIHRCLGPQPLVQVDIEGPHPVQDGDIFLMCSDGLSGQVKDHEMGVVASVLPPAEACRFLVDLANLRGGPDNITVILVRVGAKGAEITVSTTPARPKRRSLTERVPWPLLSLAAGVLLAAGAVALKLGVEVLTSLAYLLFVMAVAAIGAGGIGLWLHQKKQARVDTEELHEPRVYTQKSCHLEPEMLEKLTRAAQLLKERAAEKQWEPDLAAYDYHHNLAQQHLKEGDLAGAFREHCRAMRPLNAALNKHRSKEEVFQPVWDKDR